MNEDLWRFDPDLSDLQTAVIEHLAENLLLKEENFDWDFSVFKDICYAYMGRIFILEEPREFVPVKITEVIENLVLKNIPFKRYIENQAVVQVGPKTKWFLHLCFWEREIFRRQKLRWRNLHGSPTHPSKMVLYKA